MCGSTFHAMMRLQFHHEALSKVSKKFLLDFEDMGNLQDPLDRKMDLFLKRAWDSLVSYLKLVLGYDFCGKELRILAHPAQSEPCSLNLGQGTWPLSSVFVESLYLGIYFLG